MRTHRCVALRDVATAGPGSRAMTTPTDGCRSLRAMLDECARRLILSALERGRTFKRAAQLLRINPASLYRRCERLGIVLAPYDRGHARVVQASGGLT